MPRYSSIQNTFQRGEISEKNFLKVTEEKYFQSAAELKNGVVDYDGAFWTRPGSMYVADTINVDSTQTTISSAERIFPLLVTNPYTGRKIQYHVMLCRADGTNSAGITVFREPFAPTEIGGSYDPNLGTEATVENVSNFPNWDYPQASPVAYRDEPFHHIQIGNVLWITAPHFQTTYVRAEFDPTSPAGLPSFYYGPIWATPLGDKTVSNSYQRLPYYLNTDPEIVFEPSGTTGTITVNVRNLADTGDVDFFIDDDHIGSVFLFNSGAFVITNITNENTATAVVLDGLSATTRGSTWQESSISFARGWPRALSYFQNRLVLAGNYLFPDSLFHSESGDVSQFAIEIGASTATSDPFTVAMNQPVPWNIHWLTQSNNKLFIGTEQAEWTCSQADPTSGYAVTNINIQKESEYGSIPHQAFIYENGVLFMDKSGKILRQLIFDDLERVYQGLELTDMSEYVFDRTRDNAGINYLLVDLYNDVELAVQEMDTFSVVWIKRASALFSITLNKTRGVSALCHHELAGTGPDGGNSPAIYSLSVGRNREVTVSEYPSTDHLMMITGREINESDVYYVEMFGSNFNWKDFDIDYYTMASLGQYYRAEYFASHLDAHWLCPVSSYSVSQLGHLEGESVYVWADGYALGPFTVSSGAIDLTGQLDTDPGYAIVGLRYKQRLVTNPIEAGSAIGTNKLSITRIEQILVRFFKTLNAKFGYKWKDTANDLESVDFGTADPLAIFTGNKELDVHGSTTDQPAQIVIEHEGPYNCCVAGIVFGGETND